jgi:hypothetical protein
MRAPDSIAITMLQAQWQPKRIVPAHAQIPESILVAARPVRTGHGRD